MKPIQTFFWIPYLVSIAAVGLLLAVAFHFISPRFSWGFLYGYGVIFITELFSCVFLFWVKQARNPSVFLRKFFRLEVQKFVLFVLLMAFVLRYSRADFLGLLLGLIFALLISRFLRMI